MNKAQIKTMKEVGEAVDSAVSTLQTHQEGLQTVASELEEAIDGKSDKWREGEKGQAAQEELDNVTAMLDELSNAIDTLETIANKMQDLEE